jgi:protoporphyrin/coproporphyrin ferrochelatase
MTRLAVVLFNLGGPDSLQAVRPFLFNLFRDRAIVDLPAVARYPLAALIAGTRARPARANYALMGGASPLLPETEAQATALEAALSRKSLGIEVRSFVAMRYWAPLTEDAARAVAAFEPDEILLLPLYPQYSTTTTGSSANAWKAAYRGKGRTRIICCYPTLAGLVEAHARAIEAAFEAGGRPENLRLLFSAHGLPKRVIERGDPYQAQIEATAAAIADRLGGGWDWRICYQSRVGRLEWLGPATDAEIRRAGGEGRGVLVAPIAFVSEHIETLVELDHEYAALARASGCGQYLRARTPGITDVFVEGLANLVLDAVNDQGAVKAGGDWRCPAQFGRCAQQGRGT